MYDSYYEDKVYQKKSHVQGQNDMHETVTFDQTQMLGIIDLRSLGYYKIKTGCLTANLNHLYHFEYAHQVCDQFNRLIDTLRKEESLKGREKYPWLDDTDERNILTDKEVLKNT